MLNWLRRLIARPEYAPVLPAGSWQSGRYGGDAGCKAFPFQWQPMRMEDRRAIAKLEDIRVSEGFEVADTASARVELEILARRVRLPAAAGGFRPATEADIDELGGMSAEAYQHVRRLVLAAWYRELAEGLRAKNVRRRWRSRVSALLSELEAAESV